MYDLKLNLWIKHYMNNNNTNKDLLRVVCNPKGVRDQRRSSKPQRLDPRWGHRNLGRRRAPTGPHPTSGLLLVHMVLTRVQRKPSRLDPRPCVLCVRLQNSTCAVRRHRTTARAPVVRPKCAASVASAPRIQR